jgi:hypothetical protein
MNGMTLSAPPKQLSFVGQLNPFPAKKVIRNTAVIAGYIPVGSFTAGLTGFFSVYGNSAFEPFSTTSKPDSATGLITEVNGSDTEAMFGFSQINSIWNYARVLKSRLRVTALPTNIIDNFTIVMFALPFAAASSLPLSYAGARGQVGFREALCCSGQPIRDNTIECQTDAWIPVGLSRAQYMDQPPVVTAGVPGSTLLWFWVVQYFTNDGMVNSGTIPFRIEYAVETEYSGNALHI